MTSTLRRRTLLGGAVVAGFGFAFAGSLDAFARPEPRVPGGETGYGPLVPDPKGILSLPAGFSYQIVAQSNVTLTDDVNPTSGLPYRYPSDPDGMGVFAGAAGGSVLISNHENSTSEPARVPTITDLTYDPAAIGGTSTLTVDRDGQRLGSYTSLAGTDNNCAGGITPWGTWLTCEETERKANTLIGGRRLQKDHGFVFEVDPTNREANLGRSPLPLPFLGRYAHEAVAVDPDSHQIYLTEDAVNPNGLRSVTHKLLADIDDCLAGQRFNVMVARVMELVNAARKVADTGAGPADPAVREAVEVVTVVLSLVAPYVAEEMWEALGHPPSVASASWPTVDPSLLVTEAVTCVVQVQGKVRARLEVPPDISEDDLRAQALAADGVVRSLAGREIAKVIIRAPRLVSIVPR